MIKIVVDTNGLLAPFKHRFNIDSQLKDIFGSYEIIVPKPLIGELEKMAKTNIHARGALKLARSRKVQKTRASGDASVLELAKKQEAFILTNDKALIARAKKQGIRIIIVKETGRLVPEQGWMLF
mgnify:CR=1 FL=1